MVGTIRWHQQQIDEIRAKKSKAGKAGSKAQIAAREKKFGKTPFKYNQKFKGKKPLPRYRSRIEYDFLKYIRVVFKWAVENYPDLSRPQVELLLYLYGTGAFSMKQFNDYHKLVGMYAIKSLKKFEKDGYIKLWRRRKGKDHALYTLTHKAKILCGKMHRYSCGVEEMPDNPVSTNKMIREGAPRINNYYLDIIKRMNQDKAPKE